MKIRGFEVEEWNGRPFDDETVRKWAEEIVSKFETSKLDYHFIYSGNCMLVGYRSVDCVRLFFTELLSVVDVPFSSLSCLEDPEFCSCSNPDLVKNGVLGEEFEFCRNCGKERK